MTNKLNPQRSGRRALSIAIVLGVAAVHLLRVGSHLQGAAFDFYYSYFSDFSLPFSAYFLLCAAETRTPFLRPWPIKLGLAFGLPAFAETCQAVGIPLLGVTFDPFDYLMYAGGATAAWLLDRGLLAKFSN